MLVLVLGTVGEAVLRGATTRAPADAASIHPAPATTTTDPTSNAPADAAPSSNAAPAGAAPTANAPASAAASAAVGGARARGRRRGDAADERRVPKQNQKEKKTETQ